MGASPTTNGCGFLLTALLPNVALDFRFRLVGGKNVTERSSNSLN